MTRPLDLTAIGVSQDVDPSYNDRDFVAILAEFQRPTLTGEMPNVASHHVQANASVKDLDLTGFVPDTHLVIRRHVCGRKSYSSESLVAVAERTRFYISRDSNRVEVSVAGVQLHEARAILERVVEKIPVKDETPDGIIDAWMWYLSHHGIPNATLKKIHVPTWDDITANYVPSTADALGRMMKLYKPQASGGKIILWHGDAGTGKTTALRALGHAWKEWASFHYVSDPEKLFGEPHYLMSVGTTPGSSGTPYDDDEDEEDFGGQKPYRLVIAEDSDEFLKLNAREETGASLGRLLNFSDGILGQGSNTLVLLTTNEKITELHPAIVRPGRCMAQIQFKAFEPAAAADWFGNGYRPTGPMTLAEMIDKRENIEHRQITTGIANDSAGHYL
jgi:hypothetical protein